MGWRIAEAKQQLSKVVRLAQKEPQILQNRDEPVAAVVSVEELARLREFQRKSGMMLSVAFEELRHVASEEGWELTAPPRKDRENAFLAVVRRSRR